MRMQAESIKLGSHEWMVRPLTLRQVQEIEPILIESGLGTRGNVEAALAIVAVALRRDNPEAATGLWDIEATAPEIAVAMGVVLRLGGFIQSNVAGDPTSGEAKAGVTSAFEAPASTSHASTRV